MLAAIILTAGLGAVYAIIAMVIYAVAGESGEEHRKQSLPDCEVINATIGARRCFY